MGLQVELLWHLNSQGFLADRVIQVNPKPKALNPVQQQYCHYAATQLQLRARNDLRNLYEPQSKLLKGGLYRDYIRDYYRGY